MLTFGVPMPKFLIVLSVLSSLLFAPTAQADDEGELPEVGLLRILYPEFLDLEFFGNIRVVIEGEDAEEIGLDSDELTEFLRLKYKNNFAGFPYKDVFAEEDAEKLIESLQDEVLQSMTGVIIVNVWIVGTNYPIAYHIETTAGSLAEMSYENAVLGYGSSENVPDHVKKTINDMVEGLAIAFYKTRGEL